MINSLSLICNLVSAAAEKKRTSERLRTFTETKADVNTVNVIGMFTVGGSDVDGECKTQNTHK